MDKPEIWDELKKAGIMPNDRTRRLVDNDYMTVEYIKGHVSQLKKANKLQTGLLITILESGLPAGDEQESANGHPRGCHCRDCWEAKNGWTQTSQD